MTRKEKLDRIAGVLRAYPQKAEFQIELITWILEQPTNFDYNDEAEGCAEVEKVSFDKACPSVLGGDGNLLGVRLGGNLDYYVVVHGRFDTQNPSEPKTTLGVRINMSGNSERHTTGLRLAVFNLYAELQKTGVEMNEVMHKV